jgi:hypothetical protein
MSNKRRIEDVEVVTKKSKTVTEAMKLIESHLNSSATASFDIEEETNLNYAVNLLRENGITFEDVVATETQYRLDRDELMRSAITEKEKTDNLQVEYNISESDIKYIASFNTCTDEDLDYRVKTFLFAIQNVNTIKLQRQCQKAKNTVIYTETLKEKMSGM